MDKKYLENQASILINLHNSKRFADVIQKGKILINRKETKDLSDIQKDKLRGETISIIFQDNNLLSDFTARDNIMMPLIIKNENEKNIKAQSSTDVTEKKQKSSEKKPKKAPIKKKVKKVSKK